MANQLYLVVRLIPEAPSTRGLQAPTGRLQLQVFDAYTGEALSDTSIRRR